MDKLKKYQKILKNTLAQQAKVSIANMPLVKSKLFIDETKANYFLFDIGWHQEEFIHDCIYHFEIINGKIRGYKNITDFDIISTLIENGIDKNDIIFEFLEDFGEHQNEVLGEAA